MNIMAIQEKTKRLTTHFTLNTGAQIPAIGFGTWKAAPGGKFQFDSFS
jgi:hypothetical protein